MLLYLLTRVLIMKLLNHKSLNQERLDFTTQEYVVGEISLERAAELANISIHKSLLFFQEAWYSIKHDVRRSKEGSLKRLPINRFWSLHRDIGDSRNN